MRAIPGQTVGSIRLNSGGFFSRTFLVASPLQIIFITTACREANRRTNFSAGKIQPSPPEGAQSNAGGGHFFKRHRPPLLLHAAPTGSSPGTALHLLPELQNRWC